jgi:hypothetical protein
MSVTQLIEKDPGKLYRNSTWSSLCPNRTVQNQVCKYLCKLFYICPVHSFWMVDMLVFKLQTHASQVFLSIVCTVQKPSYLKGRPSCCDNCISIWIAKASSCRPVYVGWQLHVSYIPGLTVDPLHFVLHKKCQKLLTGI